jgi:predicted metal-dependent hydrolase
MLYYPRVMARRILIDSLTIDDLVFAVRWSHRRRTIGIAVARDRGLRVLAPLGVSARKLESTVRVKLPWVRRKLAEFEALGPPAQAKRFVDGERLPYLGRTYGLAWVDAAERSQGGAGKNGSSRALDPVCLRGGRFELTRGMDGDVRAAVVDWYSVRARKRIQDRVAHFAPRLCAWPEAIVVRDLGRRRWGVCDHRRRIVTFHWELVLQPPRIIDYIVVHELAHLREPDHGRGFWRRVEAVLPEWRAHRTWLSTHGQRHTI